MTEKSSRVMQTIHRRLAIHIVMAILAWVFMFAFILGAAGGEEHKPQEVRYCPDTHAAVVGFLPADKRLAGNEWQALFVPCDQLPHEERV